jgi:hypothetical protein
LRLEKIWAYATAMAVSKKRRRTSLMNDPTQGRSSCIDTNTIMLHDR